MDCSLDRVHRVGSSSPRRTQSERNAESTSRLARAALELIAEKGFAATTAVEISIHAGFSRAMVAAKFGSKEGLLNALLAQDYESRVNVAADPTAPGLDHVLAPIEALRVFAEDDPGLLRSMFMLNFEALHDRGALRQRIVSWHDNMHDSLEYAVTMGQADGTVRADVDAAQVATDLLATGIGYAYGWIVTPDRFDLVDQLGKWGKRVESELGAR